MILSKAKQGVDMYIWFKLLYGSLSSPSLYVTDSIKFTVLRHHDQDLKE